jgi:DNA-binding GntR family transcriptional regulator
MPDSIPDVLAQKLPDRIAAALSERIIAGTYPPGARLIEAALAAEFGVSHGPVRDALRLLEHAGLVTILPYRGAQVTALTAEELREIYEVRAALVALRARRVALDPGRADFVREMEAAVARLEVLAANDAGGEDYIAAALALNRALTERVNNRWLRATLQALTLQTARYTRLGMASAERRRESARFWRRLLEAIRAGDAPRAEALACANSLSQRDAALALLAGAARRKSPAAARRRRAG